VLIQNVTRRPTSGQVLRTPITLCTVPLLSKEGVYILNIGRTIEGNMEAEHSLFKLVG